MASFLSLFTGQSMLKRRTLASFQFPFSSERQVTLSESQDKWVLTSHFTRHSGLFPFLWAWADTGKCNRNYKIQGLVNCLEPAKTTSGQESGQVSFSYSKSQWCHDHHTWLSQACPFACLSWMGTRCLNTHWRQVGQEPEMRRTVSTPRRGRLQQQDWVVRPCSQDPGCLLEGPGHSRLPHGQEGATQSNPIHSHHWGWTPVGMTYWEFATLYTKWSSCSSVQARNDGKCLVLSFLPHPTWCHIRKCCLWGGASRCRPEMKFSKVILFILPCVGPGCTVEWPEGLKTILVPSPIPNQLDQDLWGWDSSTSIFWIWSQVVKNGELLSWTAIHSFIPSFQNYLLNTNSLPSNAACPHGAYILVKMENKQTNMQINKRRTEYSQGKKNGVEWGSSGWSGGRQAETWRREKEQACKKQGREDAWQREQQVWRSRCGKEFCLVEGTQNPM